MSEARPQAIPTIGGLELVGRADACVVAFGAKQGSGLNCYSVADCLKEIGGWELATLQNPAAVHLAVTLPTAKNATRFVDELRAAVATACALSRPLPAATQSPPCPRPTACPLFAGWYDRSRKSTRAARRA